MRIALRAAVAAAAEVGDAGAGAWENFRSLVERSCVGLGAPSTFQEHSQVDFGTSLGRPGSAEPSRERGMPPECPGMLWRLQDGFFCDFLDFRTNFDQICGDQSSILCV